MTFKINTRYAVPGRRYNLGISQEVLDSTTPFDSTEQVIEKEAGNYFVASKVNQYHCFDYGFVPRYYRLCEIDGQWQCSSTNPQTVAYCIAAVEAYRLRKTA